MIRIQGIYEIAIKVENVAKSEAFYRDLLGLEDGYRDDVRDWVFLRCPDDRGMIVLQKATDSIQRQHFAFSVSHAEFVDAVNKLRELNLVSEGPLFHSWIPATSIYFRDPDGHDVEFCTAGAEINFN